METVPAFKISQIALTFQRTYSPCCCSACKSARSFILVEGAVFSLQYIIFRLESRLGCVEPSRLREEFLLYRVDMKRALHSMAVPVPTSPPEPSLVVILGVDRGDHDYASLRDRLRKVDRWGFRLCHKSVRG